MDRKVVLIGILALIGIGFGADAAYRNYVEKPFKHQADKKSKLEKQKLEYRNKLILVKKLVRDLPDLQDRSLPADPTAARQRYQAWWWQKVKSHQWKNPSVDVGKPGAVVLDKKQKDQPPAHRITTSIRGAATLQQVTNLLDDFYATPLLQKIEAIQMTPIQGGQAVSVSLTVSALALANATEQNQLPMVSDDRMLVEGNPIDTVNQLLTTAKTEIPPQPRLEAHADEVASDSNTGLDSDPKRQQLTSSQVADNSQKDTPSTNEAAVAETNSGSPVKTQDPPTEAQTAPPAKQDPLTQQQPWQNIVKRNMFQAGGGMKIANQLVVSAVTQNAAGQQQAWFRSLDTKRTDILNEGESLQIGVLAFSVVQAQDDHVVVLVEGNKVRIKIGQTLGSGIVVN